ncbi:DUF1769-domain-containing protein [Clavulina sp. PMI_390]|nr:DUF1769-domain-containing protein [Clavulina sp. PMI_390]
MPRLRVLVGESPETLRPISANDPAGHPLKTSRFEGTISVFLKNFENENGKLSMGEEYFGKNERKGVTWSIQARGRFLKEINADDVLFGNVFDRPLSLPYGSSAAIKFMQFADPTLEDDFYGEKPWALSPLITTMPYFSIRESGETGETGLLISEQASSILPDATHARRTYFRDAKHRQDFKFTPSHHIECDFCQGLLSFEHGGLSVSFPMVHFDLMQYWDGRPVWFVCCERDKEQGKGPGAMIWCVGFEIMADAETAGAQAPEEDISGDVD